MGVYYQLDTFSLLKRLAWLLQDKLGVREDWKRGKVIGKDYNTFLHKEEAS